MVRHGEYRVEGRDSGTRILVARDGSNNWSTPLVITHGGRKQIVVAAPAAVHGYDFESGKSIWSATGLGTNTVPQPVQHGDMVIVMSGYDVVVARTGAPFEVIATNTLADQFFVATPVISRDEMFLRSRSHLFKIAGASPGSR